MVRAADVVVTMGCGDACPLFPGKRYEDWELDDPAGLGRRRGAPDPRRDRASACVGCSTASGYRRRNRDCTSDEKAGVRTAPAIRNTPAVPDDPTGDHHKHHREIHGWGADIERDLPGARYGLVLLLLLVTFVFMATGPTGSWVELVTVILQGATLLAALAAAEASKRVVRVSIVIVALGVVAGILALVTDTDSTRGYANILSLPARGRRAGRDRAGDVAQAGDRHPHGARRDLHLRVPRHVLRVRLQRDRTARVEPVLRATSDREHRRLPLLQLRDPHDDGLRRPHGRGRARPCVRGVRGALRARSTS